MLGDARVDLAGQLLARRHDRVDAGDGTPAGDGERGCRSLVAGVLVPGGRVTLAVARGELDFVLPGSQATDQVVAVPVRPAADVAGDELQRAGHHLAVEADRHRADTAQRYAGR